jgi:queuine tRNA-ribosyltransferase
MARELLAYRLNTLHNLHYYLRLMTDIRQAIEDGRFSAWRKAFYAKREQVGGNTVS